MRASPGASWWPRAPWRNTATVYSRSSGFRKRATTTAASWRSSRSSTSASPGHDRVDARAGQVGLREEADCRARRDQLREVHLRIGLYQDHGRQLRAVGAGQPAGDVEAALLAE